ncbi:MAG: twin-arginine translocase TatA/TatE family subunit [Acidobacteriota bacterium]
MIQPIILFIFDSPTQLIFVGAIIFLLFGATRLPQLAKSLGQSKRAFKEGLEDGEKDNLKDSHEK